MQAVSEKDEVEAFVSNAQTTLGNTATSIEEIGTARQGAKALVTALPHIMDCRRRIDEKNRLLKSMAAAGNVSGVGQPVDMAEVDNAWDSFTNQLQQHDTHLDEQKNQLQGQLARQVICPIMVTAKENSCRCIHGLLGVVTYYICAIAYWQVCTAKSKL